MLTHPQGFRRSSLISTGVAAAVTIPQVPLSILITHSWLHFTVQAMASSVPLLHLNKVHVGSGYARTDKVQRPGQRLRGT